MAAVNGYQGNTPAETTPVAIGSKQPAPTSKTVDSQSVLNRIPQRKNNEAPAMETERWVIFGVLLSVFNPLIKRESSLARKFQLATSPAASFFRSSPEKKKFYPIIACIHDNEKNEKTQESNKQKGWRLLPFISRDNEKIAEIGLCQLKEYVIYISTIFVFLQQIAHRLHPPSQIQHIFVLHLKLLH